MCGTTRKTKSILVRTPFFFFPVPESGGREREREMEEIKQTGLNNYVIKKKMSRILTILVLALILTQTNVTFCFTVQKFHQFGFDFSF